MKEVKIFRIREAAQATADKLNKTARNKWRVEKWRPGTSTTFTTWILVRTKPIKNGGSRNFYLG